MNPSPTQPEDARDTRASLLPPLATRLSRPGAAARRLSEPLGPFPTRAASVGDAGEAEPLPAIEPIAAEAPPEAAPAADDLPWLMPWQPSPTGTAIEGEPLLEEEFGVAEPVSSLWEEEAQWRDDRELPPLGQAEPEDELLLDAFDDSAGREQPAAEAAPAPHSEPGTEPPIVSSAGEKGAEVEEVAARLERIARTLREGGPEASLAEHAGDPLGALITGYVLGLSQASHRPDKDGGLG